MINPHLIRHGTQTTGLVVMIGRYSQDSHPVNVDCSNFSYTNNDQADYSTQRHQRKKWTREGNKNVLHCYFKNNLTQRSYRKRMIEILIHLIQESRMVLKKGLFSDLEILGICEQVHSEEHVNLESKNKSPPPTELKRKYWKPNCH